MRSRWQQELTWKLKVFFFLLCVVCLVTMWYAGIYCPVQERIQTADLEALETELLLEQTRAWKRKEMQTEIEKNRAAGVPIVPSYNHFKQEMEELNRIFSRAYEFEFHFSEPVTDGMKIRRNVAVRFQADCYDTAAALVQEILQGAYRNQIYDLSISSQQEENIKNGTVEVSFSLTYFETRYDSDTVEGLEVQEKHS